MSSSHRTASEANIVSDTNDDAVNIVSVLYKATSVSESQRSFGNDNTNDKIDGSRRPKNLQTADDTALQRRQKSSTANWNEVADKERATTIADTTTATTIATTTESTIATNTISSPKSQFIKLNMVIYYVRQFFCLLIVIVTTYATYQNIPSKQLSPPEVKPFFAAASLVEDWPSGDLFKAQAKVTLSELSFVLFYAPWSAESQHARGPYDFAARLFYKQAYFAAINCWHPVGECRQQYTKVMSWPVLMAYNQNGVAIPYSGQWTEQALISFIRTLLQPLKRIHQPDDLLDLMHNHDAVLVTYLDMLKHQTFYNIYLQTSIKWLERDPHRDIGFAVVCGEARNLFGIDREPSLRMYLWNDTLEYDSNTWKPSLIVQWIATNLQTVSIWAAPPGVKSTQLKPFINKGPVLILFSPRNLYDESNDAYAMLRQVAYEYHNCLNDEWIRDLSRVYSHQRRKEYRRYADDRTIECKKMFSWEKSDFADCASITKKSFASLVNSSKYNAADAKINKNSFCSIASNGADGDSGDHGGVGGAETANVCDSQPQQQQNNGESCLYSQTAKANYLHLESKGSLRSSKIVTSMLNNEHDVRSPDNIRRTWDNMQCKINKFSEFARSQMYYDHLIEKSSAAEQDEFDVITGLACKHNRTLSFLAMDSFTYEIFAERLGITIHNLYKSTAAVILDSENESSFVLQEPINTQNLIYFVSDFVSNKLNRHLRNNVNISYSYFYNSKNLRRYDVNLRKTVDKNLNNSNAHKTTVVYSSTERRKKFKSISLTEISSNDFERHVLETNKTVAVLFYSTQCALCTVFTNTLLYVAKVLKHLINLEIVRIDSDKNDLPWQFTMESVPAFIIFNGQNKLESRKFPSGLQVTTPHVIGFILANLDRPTRLHAMYLVLKQNKIAAIDDGLAVFKREITDSISLNLQNWRKLPHKRNIILRRIQALQQLYLSLLRTQTVNDLKHLDSLVRNILKLWIGNGIDT